MNDEGKADAVRAGGVPAAEGVALPTASPAGPRAPGGSRPADSALNEFARTRLGTHLRAMYDTVVQQPVPDQFRDLIARLEAGEARDAAASDEGSETAAAPGIGLGRPGA